MRLKITLPLLAAFLVAGCASFQPRPGQPADADDDMDSWIKHGKLIAWSASPQRPGSEVVYKYKTPAGKVVVVQNNIAGVNTVLAAEIPTEAVARDVLKNRHMAIFLFCMMTGYDDDIFDRSAGDIKPISAKEASEMFPLLSKERARELNRMKNGCRSEVRAEVKGGTWTLHDYIRKRKGAIEEWHVEGTVFPCRVTSFKRTIIEPEGTFPVEVTSD